MEDETPILKGCCPLGHNCFKTTGSKLNYYPGDCPDWAVCWATYDVVNANTLESDEDKAALDHWYYDECD